MAARKREPEAASFEDLFTQLEEKARRLEQGNLPLEESLKLYEEGASLVDQLRAVLEAAELRVRNVQGRFEPEADALREEEFSYGADGDDFGDEG